ncbi:conjugal transfer protein TrbE [Cardiobacterium valvarum]|uniref:Conjugal transfer protein TrbE n=1 Tax=Cardiobacterium valvarum TaxID=194702 RepID=A0A381E8B1_9GAMM|nr:conjugative transfer ATPase [Cardiobacterium valvarum]SUX22981.1 conjugal transfer protein TrbE [Cardiobacterium valvarum]
MRIADELLGMLRRRKSESVLSLDKGDKGASAKVHRTAPHQDEEPGLTQFKVNPFVSALLRLSGEWPLFGTPPLSQKQYRALFSNAPSFCDYFPIYDYCDEDETYLLNDGINIAKIWRVNTRYMSARSPEALNQFNEALTRALDLLPANNGDEDYPYIAQIFVRALEAENIADDFEAAVAANGLSDDPLSRHTLDITREHLNLLTHEKGVFPDSRISGEHQGWRVADQAVYLCIYSRRPERFWKKHNRSPAEQAKHDLSAFVNAMSAAGISLKPLLPHDLVNWLAPYFGHKRFTAADIASRRETAAFDLGQLIFHHPARYHRSEEANERGIWRFGDYWYRYLTIGGIDHPPRDGEITIGVQEEDNDGTKINASLFERLPQGAMMTWNIIPQTDHQMEMEIDLMRGMAKGGASKRAKFAAEQADEVQEEMMRYHHKVFYAQMGLFLRGTSLRDLLDATERASATIATTNCIAVIDPRDDLISQDSFVRALPAVYDFNHDRNAALRARKCYTVHLASLLPFYGNKSGSTHPCYLMFSRSGEPFYLNPFHPGDRSRVSHEVFFGPTGSGKSATIVYMTLMSMAVNNPRMFIFDYGNSFGLLADHMERYGKRVRRFTLNANSNDVLAPFFETQKALAEAEKAKAISAGTWVPDADEIKENEDEKRSYLNEMEYILRIMVSKDGQQLSPSEISRLNKALVRGLQISVERGEPHARPVHIRDAFLEMSVEEAQSPNKVDDIVKELRERADAMDGWTQGLRGTLFNRTAKGFDPDDDLTVIELGALGGLGNESLLAVAGLSAIYTITAMAEKLQNSGRAIEVKIDEAHLWAKIKLLMSGLVVGSKVFRKLNCWLNVITQDISDFTGDAAKILSNAEFWWLMKMSRKEVNELETIRNLTPEERHLLDFPRKEQQRFVEGVSFSGKFPATLVRYIPPSLILALGQTDGNEKDARNRLMKEHEISELEAAYMIADQITAARRKYQEAA